MARVLNLVIVILEIIAFSKARKNISFKKSLVYYTQLSNTITLISSLLLVIFGQKHYVEVLRFLSTGMFVMTFLVTVCIYWFR